MTTMAHLPVQTKMTTMPAVAQVAPILTWMVFPSVQAPGVTVTIAKPDAPTIAPTPTAMAPQLVQETAMTQLRLASSIAQQIWIWTELHNAMTATTPLPNAKKKMQHIASMQMETGSKCVQAIAMMP